jgi:hypothetical protein
MTIRAQARYRLWVNADRTVLVRLWDDGTVEFCTRDDAYDIWGPPRQLMEEKIHA